MRKIQIGQNQMLSGLFTMWTRRNGFLCLLLLPAIGYSFVMYIMIGRTCSEESFYDADYVNEDLPPRLMASISSRTNRPVKLWSTSDTVVEQAARVRQRNFAHRLVQRAVYPFNCTNISAIKIKKKIGHGVSKQTFLGEYQRGHVAVKMVTRHIHDVKSCLDNVRSDDPDIIRARSRCYLYSTMKLMKEILVAEQLHHHNMAQLLGYCVRSEESDSTDVAEHGVVSIFELGSRFVLDNLQILPWPARLRHAIEMADLLDYLEHSPLGSVVMPDFKEGHFVLVNSSLKLIDFDDINNVEPACSATSFKGDHSQCAYGVVCQRALCVGFNAKENMKNMNRLIFKRLLFPLTFPEQVVKDVGQLNAQLDFLVLTAAELYDKLVQIERKAVGSMR